MTEPQPRVEERPFTPDNWTGRPKLLTMRFSDGSTTPNIDEIFARDCSVHIEALSDDEYTLSVTVGNETRIYRFSRQHRAIKLWRYE